MDDSLFQDRIKESAFKEEDIAIVRLLLDRLVSVTRDSKIDFFLYSGALIGFYRYVFWRKLFL